MLLQVQGISKRFGGLLAVSDVSFDVEQGEIVSVIGPNGAGKSTLFKLIGSFLAPTRGNVLFQGEPITGQKPHVVARRGVVRTFQETTVFKEMTVLENVVIAHHLRLHASLGGVYFGSTLAQADERRFQASALDIIDYLGLGHLRNEQARNLPHGHLRALGIALALAAEPKLLLLDEPFSGMHPEEKERAVGMVRGIRDRGVTILLVEHDMPSVMRISDRVVVLNFGVKIAEGVPADIQRNDAVIEAYLGRVDEELGH